MIALYRATCNYLNAKAEMYRSDAPEPEPSGSFSDTQVAQYEERYELEQDSWRANHRGPSMGFTSKGG